ncbi:hypothetical protein OCH239_10310 [Roseivivax halodurans JCM 10272]|uniref:FAD-binding FR-type domain-containing protein n=1 Tax=Roseivivax halodurans JCM 10272 TaxID=1449350 RepID=X7EE30_9RHOB|nr:siderophore-interacting protein [Roseivivax halodurans]ETX13431.1 hypothetical protein OCH239_10310 [Roseivivax halodurans JCM 10272]
MSRHTSAALFRDADPIGLLDAVAADLEAQDVIFARDGDAIDCDTGVGRLHLQSEGGALRIEVHADNASNLHMLCEGVSARLDRLRHDSVALDWQGGDLRTGGLPPNVRTGQVIARSRIGTKFVRLRVSADDLSDFALSGLHIRLLIPIGGRAPVWPYLTAKGRTVWPGEGDGMHMPAYTIRAIDPEEGWLDVDVFLHGNGSTCRWAEEVGIGAEVGISGPGGGWMPPGRSWLLAGDETALPAIARILEAASDDVSAEVLVMVDGPQDVLPLAAPAGARITWLYRDRGDDLVAEVKAAPLPAGPGRHIWFAAEKSLAANVRSWLRGSAGVDRKDCYIAAYWVDGKS